ncbi:TetR/AcrR family transcriptional regulator [Streptomyces pluripotens]|uniref:TetR/AcrR family transcriptional regulator n=1 Tax=Streptomyces pluripotens TaxID=1355015 RepID=A0A221P6S4_9ACTN|nr:MULTISPECIES: TetR/AcrR family transcriptional regulator [Streptomyces]ARP73575.1 TetR family transcriptional regulator [Streptomyces pluripotens]ASN27824.1 TetR/AcrR family transcriptional regulator [Streptomyces pluripotens]MCH0557237.1 TetR/AcrR family transcriptional regulator [Streptomyces sp. MUM 16J]
MAAGELAPERRRRLLEVAAREFAARGYEHASLNAIIHTCGMSKSSFYHYMGSKAALFDTVVREATGALARRLRVPAPRELAGPHFWDRVTALLNDVLAAADREQWYAEAGKLFYLPDVPDGQGTVLREVLRSIHTWLTQALAVGRECGAVRDDLPASLQAALVGDVLQCLDRWSLQHLRESPAAVRADLMRAQIEVLHRLLAPSPRAAQPTGGTEQGAEP